MLPARMRPRTGSCQKSSQAGSEALPVSGRMSDHMSDRILRPRLLLSPSPGRNPGGYTLSPCAVNIAEKFFQLRGKADDASAACSEGGELSPFRHPAKVPPASDSRRHALLTYLAAARDIRPARQSLKALDLSHRLSLRCHSCHPASWAAPGGLVLLEANVP